LPKIRLLTVRSAILGPDRVQARYCRAHRLGQLREQGVTLEQLKIEHDMIDQHASDLIGMACGSSGGHTAASATLASLADLVASHLEKENVLGSGPMGVLARQAIG
jgi:hypothetical protein